MILGPHAAILININDEMSRLQHPTLGTLEGLASGNIVQFLGIKYGSLDHRFGSPKLYSGRSSSGVVNARTHGYVD
jgi:hypothetical protein